MPILKENKTLWDGEYNWSRCGDEWSTPWGGPLGEWQGFIFPRIQAYVPAHSIVEIGCGYGRWTQFLKEQ